MDAGHAVKPRNTAGIVGAIACMTIFALTIGLTYPLYAFVLEAQGYDEAAIGFNAAMTPLGVLASSPFYPRLAQRFGGWQVAAACLAAATVLLLLMGATQDYGAFLVLRFLLGIVDAGVFIISESWINQLAAQRSRGRVIGIYAMSLSAGFAAGPLILSVTGVEGILPFMVAAALSAAAAVAVLAIRAATPAISRGPAASPLSFVRLAPTLLVAVGVFAFWDAALLSLYPLYGLDYEQSTRLITVALAVSVLGNTFLQFPIGWIADHTSRRGVMVVCAVLSAAGAAALPALMPSPAVLLPVLFFWGAAAGGLYTMAMTELGDRFTGAELVAGNAAFAIVWGLGGLIGAPLTGAAMDLAGPSGFPATLALIFLATAAFALWRRRGH